MTATLLVLPLTLAPVQAQGPQFNFTWTFDVQSPLPPQIKALVTIHPSSGTWSQTMMSYHSTTMSGFQASDVSGKLLWAHTNSNGWDNYTIFFPNQEGDGYTFEISFLDTGLVNSSGSSVTFDWSWGGTDTSLPQKVDVILPSGYDVTRVISNSNRIRYSRCSINRRIQIEFAGSAPAKGYFSWTLYAARTSASLPAECTISPSMVPITITITMVPNHIIMTPFPAVTITVDGTSMQTGPEGDAKFTVYVAQQTHSIQVPKDIEEGPGKRAIFQSWNDGNTQNARVIVVTNSPVTLTATYKTQYYLELRSQLGTTSGNGWYDEGSSASYSLSATSFPLDGLLGVMGGKTVFEGWYESGRLVSSSKTDSIVMAGTHVLTASMRTDNTAPTIVSFLAIGLAILGIWLSTRNRMHDLTKKNSHQPPPSRYDMYLSRLEKLYLSGQISATTYDRLKREYMQEKASD